MIEQRLNNLLLLNTHKKETDALDLVEIANSFVSTIERQLNLLESFYIKIIYTRSHMSYGITYNINKIAFFAI